MGWVGLGSAMADLDGLKFFDYPKKEHCGSFRLEM